MTATDSEVRRADAAGRAESVADAFHAAVVATGRRPPFRPAVDWAAADGPMRYDHARRAVVLVPYDVLSPPRRAAMERFAAIGTLGLSGREQYQEVFADLLVAHELGHWVQEIARAPLTRWQAEYGANRIMVAFWREHPSDVATERRLANFVATPPAMAGLVPAGSADELADHFTTNLAAIEAEPARYAAVQKAMVRLAAAESPAPSFAAIIDEAWPSVVADG